LITRSLRRAPHPKGGVGHPPFDGTAKSELFGVRIKAEFPRRRDKMSENEVLANQKTILDHQAEILANQKTILENQAAIKQNQDALQKIIQNQEKILAALKK